MRGCMASLSLSAPLPHSLTGPAVAKYATALVPEAVAASAPETMRRHLGDAGFAKAVTTALERLRAELAHEHLVLGTG